MVNTDHADAEGNAWFGGGGVHQMAFFLMSVLRRAKRLNQTAFITLMVS